MFSGGIDKQHRAVISLDYREKDIISVMYIVQISMNKLR